MIDTGSFGASVHAGGQRALLGAALGGIGGAVGGVAAARFAGTLRGDFAAGFLGGSSAGFLGGGLQGYADAGNWGGAWHGAWTGGLQAGLMGGTLGAGIGHGSRLLSAWRRNVAPTRTFAQRVSDAESLISRHAIDMTNAPVDSATNALGFQRNGPWFWRQLRNQKPEMFSPANLRRIMQGRSPLVDEAWLKHNPQHAGYLDDKLIHHHIDQGRMASGLPETIHQELFDLLHRRTLD